MWSTSSILRWLIVFFSRYVQWNQHFYPNFKAQNRHRILKYRRRTNGVLYTTWCHNACGMMHSYSEKGVDPTMQAIIITTDHPLWLWLWARERNTTYLIRVKSSAGGDSFSPFFRSFFCVCFCIRCNMRVIRSGQRTERKAEREREREREGERENERASKVCTDYRHNHSRKFHPTSLSLFASGSERGRNILESIPSWNEATTLAPSLDESNRWRFLSIPKWDFMKAQSGPGSQRGVTHPSAS